MASVPEGKNNKPDNVNLHGCSRLHAADEPLTLAKLFADQRRWLALLLGRYRLSVARCISLYIEIANSIDPKAAGERNHSKSNQRTRLDQTKLIAKIDQIIERYDLDPHLLERDSEAAQDGEDDNRTRCKYA